jgi:hypothetical protein
LAAELALSFRGSTPSNAIAGMTADRIIADATSVRTDKFDYNAINIAVCACHTGDRAGDW